MLGGTDVKHDIMCHDVATLENCKTIAPRCQAKPRCYGNPRIRYFYQISARPNRAPYPRIRSCNSVKRLNFSSNSHIWMEHMQKVTNINHVKFDIHTLVNMEVTRTFMFNLHIQTILAKIMWDKLAECTASTIDQFLKLFAFMQIASMSALGRRLPFGPFQYCSLRCSPSRTKYTPGVGCKECYRNRSRTLTVNWEKLVFGHSTSLGNSQE